MKRNTNFYLALIICRVIWIAPLNAQYKIERVEPPYWWVGMKNPTVQILMYGNGISELEPRITYAGVTLARVVKTGNPNYLFLDLELSGDAEPGTISIDFLSGKKVVVRENYELHERSAGSFNRQGYNTSDVIYQIVPDRFANGDPANDSMEGLYEKPDRRDPTGRHGGDLEGIMDHLDYIREMGFTTIWLTPIIENNQKEFSYHGYSATDFYRSDPRMGTNDDFKKMVSMAKTKGIKVIMDVVLNHIGSEHWWMKDLPTDDWINNRGNFVPTNHERTTLQDPYSATSDKELFSRGWFVRSMPDLNQSNNLLATYLIQNTIWWIEFSGIQGIRVDTYPYSDPTFLKNWSCRIMNEYPGFNMVGEEWSLNPAIVAYWQKDKQNWDGYESCLPGMMDFPLQDALVHGLTQEETWNSGIKTLYRMLANDFLYAHPENLVVFPDNHDMSRIFTQLGEDTGLFKLALTFILTTRGIPHLLYGTEIQMSNKGTTDHGIIRSDFPGGWNGDSINTRNNVNLSDDQLAAKDFVKKILNWRKNSGVIHSGKLLHFVPEKEVYVYFRYDDNQTVMVILGKNQSPVQLDLSRFSEILPDKKTGYDVLSDIEIDLPVNMTIPPKQVMILELR